MSMHIKENYECFLGSMLSIYRASYLAFPEDHQLEKAKAFSQEILNMGIASLSSRIHSISPSQEKLKEIEHELRLQWLARMDHLEHRWYIERGGDYYLWMGKNDPLRISYDDKIFRLAKENFIMRQSAYRKELEELQRWSKETGLSEMGFGREKRSYCYFAIAATTSLPLVTDVRKEVAKCAILITVADDFFDEKGSMHELSKLIEAVQSSTSPKPEPKH